MACLKLQPGRHTHTHKHTFMIILQFALLFYYTWTLNAYSYPTVPLIASPQEMPSRGSVNHHRVLRFAPLFLYSIHTYWKKAINILERSTVITTHAKMNNGNVFIHCVSRWMTDCIFHHENQAAWVSLQNNDSQLMPIGEWLVTIVEISDNLMKIRTKTFWPERLTHRHCIQQWRHFVCSCGWYFLSSSITIICPSKTWL